MAYGNSPKGGDDYFSDSPAEESKPETNPDETKTEDSDESPTAVLPKSILMGKEFKPGDEIVLKIDRIHDDQVEVSYAPEKKEGAEEGEGGGMEKETDKGPAYGGGDSEMASMMT